MIQIMNSTKNYQILARMTQRAGLGLFSCSLLPAVAAASSLLPSRLSALLVITLAVAAVSSTSSSASLSTSVEGFIEYPGFDSFPKSNAHQAPFVSPEKARAECIALGYSGFVVGPNGMVYFRAESSADLLAHKVEQVGATLFVLESGLERPRAAAPSGQVVGAVVAAEKPTRARAYPRCREVTFRIEGWESTSQCHKYVTDIRQHHFKQYNTELILLEKVAIEMKRSNAPRQVPGAEPVVVIKNLLCLKCKASSQPSRDETEQWVSNVLKIYCNEETETCPPFLVIVQFVFDNYFSQIIMHVLASQPKHFTSRLVVACTEPMFPRSQAAIADKFTSLLEDVAKDRPQRTGGPWIVAVPRSTKELPLPGRNGGIYDRPRDWLLAASFSEKHDPWLRPKLLSIFSKPFGSCDKSGCLGGFQQDDPNMTSPRTSPLLEQSAKFCLEPPGDTPTRSHFYAAVAHGCIPVIFDGTKRECSHCSRRLSSQGVAKGWYSDERNQKTAWPWRDMSAGAAAAAKSPFAIDYSSFTVVIDGHAAVSNVSVVLKAVQEANKDYARLRANLKQAMHKLLYSCDPDADDAFTALVDTMSCVL